MGLGKCGRFHPLGAVCVCVKNSMYMNVVYKHTHTAEFYSATMKNTIVSSEGKKMELEIIMLSETSQTDSERQTIHVFLSYAEPVF